MAIQLSAGVRNARLDSIETTVGGTAILKIFTGSPPASCSVADSGTLLMSASLPADWLAAASGGTKAKSGTWQTTSANATGQSGYFRIYDASSSACGMQGTVTASGGGGDMTLDSTSANIAAGQTVTINTFVLTDGNA